MTRRNTYGDRAAWRAVCRQVRAESRRRAKPLPDDVSKDAGQGLLILGCIAVPAVGLLVVTAWATVRLARWRWWAAPLPLLGLFAIAASISVPVRDG